jgi:hypothetical protein
MTQRFQKRKGIGNVITTLIILIASVVLGAGVIFFGGSMFQTNTQSESIKVSNVNSWVDATGATTAFVVQNTGSKAVTISSISLRGVSVPTASWHYNIENATATNIQTTLPVDHTPAGAGGVVLDAGAIDMIQGTISLAQGEAAIVYMMGAGDITEIDAGNTYSLQIQAGQAVAVQQVQVITASE